MKSITITVLLFYCHFGSSVINTTNEECLSELGSNAIDLVIYAKKPFVATSETPGQIKRIKRSDTKEATEAPAVEETTEENGEHVVQDLSEEESTTPSAKTKFLKGLKEGTKMLKNFKKVGEAAAIHGVDIAIEKTDQALKEYSGPNPHQEVTDGFLKQFHNKFSKVCFERLGCFTSSEFTDFSNRPIPTTPMSPDAIDAVFHVYNPELSRAVPRNFSYNATTSQLKYSTFNASFRTAVIIHGFQSGFAQWMENMKDYIFLKSNDSFNVILVVWEKGSKVPLYNLAATNTRVVGAMVALFIDTLTQTFNIKNDRFWFIGHSLGAHTSGYAAKRLTKPRVRRITGLDPAGVGFHFSNGALRLDHSDAVIVDVLHTDAAASYTEGFGHNQPLGHFDFFPNGGSWQPGCPKATSISSKISSLRMGDDITCSHGKSYGFLNDMDKPEDDCSAIAYQCFNYGAFLEGRCADCAKFKCQPMGLNPDYWWDFVPDNSTINLRYYINTGNLNYDYCLHHFQVAIHVSKDSDTTTGWVEFVMNATVKGETKELKFKRIMSNTMPKRVHSLLLNFDFMVHDIQTLTVQWSRFNVTEQHLRGNRGYKLRITYVEFNYMSHKDKEYRQKYSWFFCQKDYRIIPNRQPSIFARCDEPKGFKRANELGSDELVPFTDKRDINFVDYAKVLPLHHKIASSRWH